MATSAHVMSLDSFVDGSYTGRRFVWFLHLEVLLLLMVVVALVVVVLWSWMLAV